MNDDVIHCVFGVDDGYCQHLAVALASLLANNTANRLDLIVVHGGLSEPNQRRLRAVVDGHANAALTLHELEKRSFSHLPEFRHLTGAAYFRLFLPTILPPEVRKVIYIDSDTVVLTDLRELWELHLEGNAIAAAPEYGTTDQARLGLSSDVLQFNSGVMLIDLDLWRSEDLLPRFLAFIERNADIMLYGDQDALNFVLQRRVRFIGVEWNYRTYMRYGHVDGSGMSEREFDRIAAHPRIVHYAGGWKPWRYVDNVRHEAVYLRYIRETPWRSFRQPDKTLRRVLRRHLKRRAPGVLAMVAKLRGRS